MNPKCRSVQNIFDGSTFNKINRNKLKFDNKKLNLFFEDGLINYSLIEIVGNCGSGKTQFVLTLCAEQLLKISPKNKKINNLNIKEAQRENIILYVYVNRMFPMNRLIEIIENKISEKKNYLNKSNVNENNLHESDSEKNKIRNKKRSYSFNNDLKDVIKNLYIYKVNDEEDCFLLFKKHIFYILKYYRISILIIDSINSIFNANQNLDNNKKNQLFIKLSLILKKLSYENNFFVILINNSYIKKECIDFSFNIADYVISSSCANTILFFKKLKKNNETVRKIVICHSEFLSRYKTLKFQITDIGFNIL